MKLVLSIVLMGLASLGAFATEPTTSNLVVVTKTESETFKLIYSSELTSKVKVTIYDKTGEIVYAETVKGISKFSRPLNFKGMKAGEYTIEVVDANGLQQREITFSPIVK